VAQTKRRIEITTNRDRLIILKRSKGASAQWCSVCSGQIVMLTTDEAATIANVSSRTIYSRAEAGEIHFVETPDGHLLICANSILGA
jgi:excisionase family DNA binding protein